MGESILQTVSKVKDTLVSSSLNLFTSHSSQKDSLSFGSLSFSETLQQEYGRSEDFSSRGSAFSNEMYEDSSDSYSRKSAFSVSGDDSDSLLKDSRETASADRSSELKNKEASTKEKNDDAPVEKTSEKEKGVKENEDSEDKKAKKVEDDSDKAVAEKDGEENDNEEKVKKHSKDGEEDPKDADEAEKTAKKTEETEEAGKNSKTAKKEDEALDLELKAELAGAKKESKSDGTEEKVSLESLKDKAAKEAESINEKIQEAVKTIEALQKEIKPESAKEVVESVKNGNSSLTENLMKNIADSKQADKGRQGAAGKKSSSGNETLSELGKEGADVKVKKMTFENNASGDANSNPKELLRTLLNRSRRNIQQEDTEELNLDSQNSSGEKGIKNLFGEMAKNNMEAEVLNNSRNTAPNLFKSGAEQKIFEAGAKPDSSFDSKPVSNQTQHVFIENTITGASARFAMQSGMQSMSSGAPANLALVQELMARMQGMLRGANLDSGSKLSMDFEAGKWGEMSLTLQQKNGSLSVSLEVGNEASKEQLMDQREDMEQHLRQMGYKDVVFDVSGKGREKQHDESQQKQQKKGNEAIENVKLAGNDKEDMAQILSGAYMA